MGRDYYVLLDVRRDATDEDIKRAYRKLAMKWHPGKAAIGSREEASRMFREVAEAYEVLSDPSRRAVFDQFGEDGLKEGVPDHHGELRGGYRFSGNPEQVFETFFGTNNPFADVFGGITTPGSMFGTGYGGVQSAEEVVGDATEHELVCTLAELYNGCTKKVKINRRRMNPDGKTSNVTEKVLTIEVVPGWRQGTKITFTGEGDEAPGVKPGDVVFCLKEKAHDRFSREGSDLVYVADITLLQALTGTTVEVHTLDGRVLAVPVAEIVSPQLVKTISGEGFVNTKTGSRGNLIVRFNILFPTHLSDEQRSTLKSVLKR
eukprot:GILJ01000973.1.p1 GENE.GILJ01000973.1~~GILJ01000973.1.p1  ORF type:complete len:318 (-),score=40.71 GILJ01000973.1:76-1029(-)